jgi:hypothetical protein
MAMTNTNHNFTNKDRPPANALRVTGWRDLPNERAPDVENRDDLSADVVESLEPWPEPVDGGALANVIQTTLSRHVTFADQADPIAATLWVFGTYLMDVWRLWPKVLISSPAKRCGKSTLALCRAPFGLPGFRSTNDQSLGTIRPCVSKGEKVGNQGPKQGAREEAPWPRST